MYQVKTTNKFNKDLKTVAKRGFNIDDLKEVINILKIKGKLPAKYKPHKLTGNYVGHWECHIKADWLLIWKQNNKELILLMTDTGSHSDLFD